MAGKIDKMYQNKPKLFRMNNPPNSMAVNNYMMPQQPFMSGQFMQYPPQTMPYPPQMMPETQYLPQQFIPNIPPLQIPPQINFIQEQDEPISSNQFSQSKNTQQQEQDQNQSIKSGGGNNNIDPRRMPPPPPPPPEMIKALAQLMQSGQTNQFSHPQQPIPQYYPQLIPSMMPQSLIKSSHRIKLTSHIYKNQNASQAPLNPQFIKTGKTPKVTEKEKLYQANTGYVIDEEQEDRYTNNENNIKIVVRGENDLIQSGVTTERDENEDQIDPNITQGEKKFISQQFLIQESITESQFKGQVPRLYVDPAHACIIEEQKIAEKEKEENEFQKKKEVFLMKNKYKKLKEIIILNKMKTAQLMEKLLKQDLDEIESKNREQEIIAQLEGEEIRKYKNQTRDLEKIIIDIRQERDYKTIQKVLGVNLEKPLDEVIDLEKIKADYALEEMYKRNQELYDKANTLFDNCNYFVDSQGKHHDNFNQNSNQYQIEKFSKKQSDLHDYDDYYTDDDRYEESENQSNYMQDNQSRLLMSRNNSQLAQSMIADSQLMSAKSNKTHEKGSQVFNYGNQSITQSQRVRFEKSKQFQLTDEQKKQRDFYLRLQNQIREAESKLQGLCEYDPDIKIDITNDNIQKQKSLNNTQKQTKQPLKNTNTTLSQTRASSQPKQTKVQQKQQQNNLTLKKKLVQK